MQTEHLAISTAKARNKHTTLYVINYNLQMITASSSSSDSLNTNDNSTITSSDSNPVPRKRSRGRTGKSEAQKDGLLRKQRSIQPLIPFPDNATLSCQCVSVGSRQYRIGDGILVRIGESSKWLCGMIRNFCIQNHQQNLQKSATCCGNDSLPVAESCAFVAIWFQAFQITDGGEYSGMADLGISEDQLQMLVKNPNVSEESTEQESSTNILQVMVDFDSKLVDNVPIPIDCISRIVKLSPRTPSQDTKDTYSYTSTSQVDKTQAELLAAASLLAVGKSH